MNRFLFAASLLAISSPAFAQNVFCSDDRNGDNIIQLVVENGHVVSAQYSNMDHGSIDDQALSAGEYVYNGATLTFAGDTYSCQ